MSIAREGWPYILTLFVLAALIAWFRVYWLAGTLAALSLFTAFFFRDPERVPPPGASFVLSPADGKVVKIGPAPAGNLLGDGAQQLSIFLSIFDVHVNRSPVAGIVEAVDYHKGEFLPAFDEKASLRNEQNTVSLKTEHGRVVFKQIAGLIARRIIFKKKVGETVARGERVGMIKFGSRVDVLLPASARLSVRLGERVRAGTSVLGELQ
jgi:phosphatidylserine decarboxylase